ncbi:MAG TPA: AI-2E family transporter, partial [Bryobacteraceae bacterium]|nr:AI-2E family transporter [Bryobacteraceae bacterium]
ALASFFVCTVAIFAVYLAGLGIYSQIAGLADEVPKYSQRITEIVDKVLDRVDAMEKQVYELVVPKRFREQQQPPQQQQPKQTQTRRKRNAELPAPPVFPPAPVTIPEVRIRPERPPLVDFLYSYLKRVYETLLMASFVPFLVYFMLSWREHIHLSFLQLFHGDARIMAAKSVAGIAAMVRAFVVGNCVLGVLLAVSSTAVFWWFSLPYPFLVGPLSGLLSLVPYIGLPLALVPPFVAALAIYNNVATYAALLTVVAVLHLIAMNLLYPKIVGTRVHLNPLAVTIALMFWSVLWGAPGLVLAIPLTAGIKAVCDHVSRLEPIGKLLGD